MDNIELMESFGYEESANMQEAAEPARPDDATGARGQDVADPDGASDTDTDTSAQNASDSTSESPDNSTDDDPNARYAAARRKAEAERDAAIASMKAQSARDVDDAIASLGLVNPYTNTPIRNKSEFEAYKTSRDAETRQNIQKKTGLNDQQMKSFIDNLPEVQEARRIAETARRDAAQKEIDSQMAEITRLNPKITKLEDLTKLPEYPQIYERVKRGYAISDAYKLACMNDITNRNTQAAKQAALNSAASKEHFAATTSRGQGALSVPEDIKAMYRRIDPKVTDAEIAAHYNKYHTR